jgi:hypothetical protein
MENLNKALSELTSADADKLFEMFLHSPLLEKWDEPYVLADFVHNAADYFLSYRHGSDMYDEMFYARRESLDDDGNSEEFYEPDLSDVKDNFGLQLVEKLKNSSFKDIEGFDELYAAFKLATTFDGSEDDLEDLLKKSGTFIDTAFTIVTRYDG